MEQLRHSVCRILPSSRASVDPVQHILQIRTDYSIIEASNFSAVMTLDSLRRGGCDYDHARNAILVMVKCRPGRFYPNVGAMILVVPHRIVSCQYEPHLEWNVLSPKLYSVYPVMNRLSRCIMEEQVHNTYLPSLCIST